MTPSPASNTKFMERRRIWRVRGRWPHRTSISSSGLVRPLGRTVNQTAARQRVSGECRRSECRIGVGAPLGATQPGGVHPPERGFFRKYWPFREHVCRPAVNRKAENSVVEFVWLRKHAKFEATLQRGTRF